MDGTTPVRRGWRPRCAGRQRLCPTLVTIARHTRHPAARTRAAILKRGRTDHRACTPRKNFTADRNQRAALLERPRESEVAAPSAGTSPAGPAIAYTGGIVQISLTQFTRPRGRRLRYFALAAAALAASAYWIHRCSRNVEADYPPQGRLIEVDGVRLHVVIRGSGDPLVLLHGNGSNVLDLELSGLLDRAAERYRVIAFDRPGFGYSARPHDRPWTAHAQAELLHKALRQLGITRPIVAAHSSGTQVALELALNHPRDVRSLVLLSGYYYPSPRADALLMSVPALPLIGALLRHTLSPWLARLLWPLQTRVLFSPAPVASSFRAYPPWMSLRPNALRAAAAEYALAIVTAAKLRGRYSRLEMPVVVLAGADDRFIAPGWNSVRLHQEIAGSELTLVPGAGHMVHHSVPEEVMTAIDAAAAAPIGRSQQSTRLREQSGEAIVPAP